MSALQKTTSLFLFILFVSNLFIFTPTASAAFQPLSTENYEDGIAVQRLFRNSLVATYVATSGENPLEGSVYSEQVQYSNVNGVHTMNSIPGIGPGDPQGGALGMASNTIASILSTPPTSSKEYLANLGENIGIAPKSAYAQVTGSGQSVIQPVIALWQVTRNIAYTGFILVFMAAGMMIMFRQKLNPQTVIGIQQALPGIVVGLILVTFSYFIAALIVDLSFVSTKLVTEIFISTNKPNYFGCTVNCNNETLRSSLTDTYNKSDAFNMYQRVALRVNNVTDVFRNLWGTLAQSDTTNYEQGTLGDNLRQMSQSLDETGGTGGGVIPGLGLGGIVGTVTATLASLIVPLILMIALLIQFVRLIIALLMSYLQILLMVIFGPILIMVSAVPGRGGALSYWLKGLFANALVFPAVFAGFLFAGLLLEWNNGDANAINMAANMPLFGGIHGDVLKSLLAFGVLLGLPAIPDMVRDAMGVKAPQGLIKAAMGGFMGGVNVGRAGATGGYNQAMEKTGIRAQQQAYQKAKIDAASGHYTTAGGVITGGGPNFGTGLIGRGRRWLVQR